jgi:hypothetical protein
VPDGGVGGSAGSGGSGGSEPGGHDTEPVLPWQDPYAQQPPTTPHNPYLTPEDTFPTSSPYAQPVDPAAYAAEHEDARGTEPEGDGRGGGRAGGTHRARRSPMRYVLPAILGALVLVLIGIGMAGWLSSNPNQGASPAQSQVHVSTPATTASTPTASKPTASVSQSPTTAPTHSASPSPKPRPTATKPPPPPVVHAPTIVLNETTQTGLAAEVAQHLRSLGWTVTGVGNWRGNISTTTVYYSPGQLAAARRLAYDLGVSRLRPAVPGMLDNHLTVVLTSDPLN